MNNTNSDLRQPAGYNFNTILLVDLIVGTKSKQCILLCLLCKYDDPLVNMVNKH